MSHIPTTSLNALLYPTDIIDNTQQGSSYSVESENNAIGWTIREQPNMWDDVMASQGVWVHNNTTNVWEDSTIKVNEPSEATCPHCRAKYNNEHSPKVNGFSIV